MTLRSALRGAIRDELNDNAATKVWTDTQLNTYLVEAIRSYSRELPKEASATLTVVAGTEGYALPSDFVKALRVEQPNDVMRWPLSTLRTYNATDSMLGDLVDWQSSVGASGGKPGYRIWAGSILLDPIPTAAGADEDIRLEYYARYAEPSADGDTIATPSSDDDLLVRLAAARALDWISTDEAKRQRYERQRGVSTYDAARHYRELVEEEFARRRSVVRTTTLELSE